MTSTSRSQAHSRVLEDRYSSKFDKSQCLHARGERALAGTSAHDSWEFSPFPVYFDRAVGASKWDISGNRFIDYWMGHGSLLCGHSFTPVIEAVQQQVLKGTHLGGASELQIVWAEKVSSLIPSAERIRFTSSGTEATMLAARVARAFTGRSEIVKLDGHFHGWHDEAMAHFIASEEAGINPAATDHTSVGSECSFESIFELLEDNHVAAIILEPGGGGTGSLPMNYELLSRLRKATIDHGTLLIFDEVISGFRYDKGGVQKMSGVLPDLTVLAKILCGGLPGGAIAGNADVMAVFGKGLIDENGKKRRVPHTGTFNGNPISAASGIAMLNNISDGKSQEIASANAALLVRKINKCAADMGVDVNLCAQSSIVHIMIGAIRAGAPILPSSAILSLYASNPSAYATLRRALLLEGVDMHPVHGWVSTTHDAACIEETADAFGRAFLRLNGITDFTL